VRGVTTLTLLTRFCLEKRWLTRKVFFVQMFYTFFLEILYPPLRV